MKTIQWGALACVSVALAGCPQDRQADRPEPADSAAAVRVGPSVAMAMTSAVTLTVDPRPITATTTQGERYSVGVAGTWRNTGPEPVYLQVTDSAGTFVAPAPRLAEAKFPSFRLLLSLPTTTPVGAYSGTFTVRACADALCTQPYADTAQAIAYTLQVVSLGEWESLQRTSRHDGYVPAQIDASRYQLAWTWQRPTSGTLSGVVTDGALVYVSEPGGTASVRALRASDGVPQWRRVFASAAYSTSPAMTAPTVSNGLVYVATTGHEDTWLYALRANDGLQAYQSRFYTQWGQILNPTVHNGKAFVNAGYYGGVVYAFNAADGAATWEASGGTYGMNTPAVDDAYAYVHNGATLSVLDTADGSLAASIGPTPSGLQTDYNGTPMLGSADHVLAFSGASNYYYVEPQRQLLNYSVINKSVRWMSNALYGNYPAVARGVVYATSNETRTFDAINEDNGRVLWSWKPTETTPSFIGNVVVTDNVAFVSTATRIYAIDLKKQRTVWSAPTPGTMAISASRMLFVTSPGDPYSSSTGARITAYKLR